ncbi:MAG: helix-turn-helix domain-containing protein [Methylacidiphilales bacterium]|nr:helix-turn-helix domain-containing protein [Candidatus Methylacidiphilales bacterium]
MKKIAALSFDELPKTYEGLCLLLLPRPIHDKMELENSTEMVDLLAGHKLNVEQEDYLDLLSDIIADYEEECAPVKVRKMAPLEALKYLLQENGMNASQLAALLGVDRSLGARIVRGERYLTAEHISKLAKHFAVNPGIFLD